MIRYLGLRLAASAMTLGVVLNPAPAHVATTAPSMQFHDISVQVAGKGDPVMLIPGLSRPRAVRDGVVPNLAKKHRAYVVLVNGLGGDASANLAPGIFDGVIDDLHGLIAGATVAGHSLLGQPTRFRAALDAFLAR